MVTIYFLWREYDVITADLPYNKYTRTQSSKQINVMYFLRLSHDFFVKRNWKFTIVWYMHSVC